MGCSDDPALQFIWVAFYGLPEGNRWWRGPRTRHRYEQAGPAHSAFFLFAVFPRDVFATAFLRVMCDFSAAPMRD